VTVVIENSDTTNEETKKALSESLDTIPEMPASMAIPSDKEDEEAEVFSQKAPT
jgi:hypothetical protein